MINKAYIIVSLADLHFGASDSESFYEDECKPFLKFIDELPLLHLIVIKGDYFDHKLSLNSKPAKYAMKFMRQLRKRARKRGFKIRIIYGTESHEVSQYSVLYDYESENDVDFRIIEKVSEEDIFPNMKVLYVPEEYMKNKKEYYKEFLNKTDRYDMVFGHGIFEEIAYIPNESENGSSKAPVFNADEFINICKGPIMFGHIHTPQIIKNQIYYTGSFQRFCHGEEEPKGFNLIAYVPETNDYVVKYVPNIYAKKYITKDFTYLVEVEDDIQKIVGTIISFKNEYDIYNLRVYISDNGEDTISTKINMLKEYFSSNKNIKLKIDSYHVKKTKEQEIRYQEMKNEYDFIFDKGLKHEEILQLYIKKKTKKEISLERISKLIYND